MNKPLYREDFVLWLAEQAKALRRAGAVRVNTPDPIDWDNVAEEIETLGRSERNALRSRVQVIVEHLMKMQCSPAQLLRADRSETIRAQRTEVDDLLEDSPSLRGELPGILGRVLPRARRNVRARLADHDEQPLTDLDRLTYSEDQVLGDWFPTPPPGTEPKR